MGLAGTGGLANSGEGGCTNSGWTGVVAGVVLGVGIWCRR
jgi:hypothetical protein